MFVDHYDPNNADIFNRIHDASKKIKNVSPL